MLEIKANLETTKTKLETEDFTGLTKDDILGDMLYTTALSYYAELDTINYIQARTQGVNISRLPSENIFSFELDVITSFYDTPLSAGSGGLAMDVDHNIHAVKALDGDLEKPKQFMLASGYNSSALEHSVPEQLFSTPENTAEGISAVKALHIANNQGIPIYTINQTNISTILPQLELDTGTLSHIQNAVNAGKEVTVSKTTINFNGWVGAGYIIIDPNTGAGAYMISGGLSGGWLFWVGVAGLIIAIIAIGLICLFSGICAVIAAGLITVFNAIVAAIEAIITTIILVYNAAKLWTLYLMPFLAPAAVACLEAPSNVPWIVTYIICPIILAIVFIFTTGKK